VAFALYSRESEKTLSLHFRLNNREIKFLFEEMRQQLMNSSDSIRTQLLMTLVARSKQNPNEFVALAKQDMDSGLVRQIVADLRIEGYVEEQTRGVIRLTQLGFNAHGDKIQSGEKFAWLSAAQG
jgi:predicted transcriptional regulator